MGFFGRQNMSCDAASDWLSSLGVLKQTIEAHAFDINTCANVRVKTLTVSVKFP